MNSVQETEAAGVPEAAAERRRTRKYQQAAIVYFGYGVLYLARVVAMGERSGWNLHGYSPLYAWILLPVGLAITIGFPILICRRIRWFTMALAIVVFIRTVYLFIQANVDFFLGPFLVAAVTAWMLARAAWDL